MRIKPFIRTRGLAFIPALILFVIVVAIVGYMMAVLIKVAKKVVDGQPPYNGPSTNTPTTDTFVQIPMADLPVTPEQLQWLMATSANTNSEFEFYVQRSTNLTDWVQIVHTNTVNHQFLWQDPNPPYPNGFYKTQIVIP